MRAKTIDFKRGLDPFKSLDIGILRKHGISLNGPFIKYPHGTVHISHILDTLNQYLENTLDESPIISASPGAIDPKYKWKGKDISYEEIVSMFFHFYDIDIENFENYIPRLGATGVFWEKFLNENTSFIKSDDPKTSLGLGAWRKGYIINKEPAEIVKDRMEFGYYRVNFQGEEWNFSKKEFDPDEVRQTEVTPDMELVLDVLPVVTFRYYKDQDGIPGLFDDWPEDFPFRKTPFIANCLEEEDRTFLIEPEGYNYARYSTELI